MRWFRLYSDLIHDPKVLRVPIKLRWRWIELLCIANENNPRGELPSVADLALILRAKEYDLRGDMGELSDRFELLERDGESFRPHNWDARQFLSDARATDGRRQADGLRRRDGEKWVISPQVRGESAVTDPDPDPDPEQIQKHNQTHPIPLPSRSVVMGFEQCFARLLSPMELEQVKALEDEQPKERIEFALGEAAALNKRSVRYVQRTCERIEADAGNSTGAGSNGANASQDPYGVANGVRNRGLESRSAGIARLGRGG